MAVVRTIQGYVLPDSGLRRFSVRKTAVFSWALPTTTIPSDLLKRDRYSWVTSSLRCPLVNVIKGICSRLTKRSTAAMNDLLMAFISAEDAKIAPRWKRKNEATPRSVWSRGWYTLRYIRSIPSTSRVTWLLRTSATERGRLIGGSGRHDPSGSTNRYAVQIGDASSIPLLGTTGAIAFTAFLQSAWVTHAVPSEG